VQEIKLNQQTFHGPGSWNELKEKDLIALAKCMESKAADQMLVNYALICAFFMIPVKALLKLKKWQLPLLTEVLDFLHDRNELGNWLIKSIKPGFRKLHGPKNRLSDLNAAEFAQVEAYYDRYLLTGEDQYLNGLIAALYRPGRLFSDKRLAYSPERIDRQEKKVAKLPRHIKLAIYVNYTGCRNIIVRLHPNIFFTPVQNEDTHEAHKTEPIKWNQYFLDVSGPVLGNYEEVKKQNIWIVLKHMDDLVAAQRRRK
jgi:hypothetical protein